MTTMEATPVATSGLCGDKAVPMDVDDKSDVCTETIERIIIACEERKDSRTRVFEATTTKTPPFDSTVVQGGGSLRSQELAHLSRLCISVQDPLTSTAASSIGDNGLNIGDVQGDLLASLFSLLEEHVCSAAQVDLVKEACQALEPEKKDGENPQGTKMTIDRWLKGSPDAPSAASGPGMKRIFVLKNGLEAASIMLAIMSCDGVDRRVVSEDCIEACSALIRQHLSKHIIPAISHTGHMSSCGTEAESKGTDLSPPPVKKQRKSPKKVENKEQRLIRNLKQVYKHILESSDLFLCLVERMDVLVQSVSLEDGMILTLATTALSTFAIDPASSAQSSSEARLCHLLHVASISLLTTIFQKYRNHRTIVIEDLFPLMLKLPTSKRSLRTFSVYAETEAPGVSAKRALFPSSALSDNSRQCIQAISVLVLSLIQCCVEMPRVNSNNNNKDDQRQEHPQKLKSGLGQCQWVCNAFAAQLLQRCARKGGDGGASEYRPILTNLVDDMLLLLLSPEYPAAGMLLVTINRNLSNDMLKASSIVPKTSDSPTVEVTYLTTAFDILGKICGSSARILAAYKAKPLNLSKSEDENKARKDDVTTNDCHCGRPNLSQAFMVNCDSCHGWYHGNCVGITIENVPHVWICDDCRLKQLVVEEIRAFAERPHNNQANGLSPDCVSDTHILRQLLLNRLTEDACRNDSTAGRYARQVHLAQWIEELCACQNGDLDDADRRKDDFVSRVVCERFLQQWDGPMKLERAAAVNHSIASSSHRCLNKEGNVRLMLNLAATKSSLVLSFAGQLGLLIKLMEDEQTSVRKLSVKAISQIVEADPQLMLHPAVKQAVSQRFVDDAKSVREASVALVGAFVVSSPEIANAFHSPIVKCLTDEGVSVKKRTVKILRQVMLSNPKYEGRASACAVMLRQAADPKEDDSVRDIIHDLFTKLWLENDCSIPVALQNDGVPAKHSDSSGNDEASSHPNHDAQAVASPAGTGIVTPLTPHGSSAITATDAVDKKKPRSVSSPRQTRVSLAAKQMFEVVMAADSKYVLTALLKELMFGFNDAEKDRKASELHSQCCSIVDALMEQLLGLEETRTSYGQSFGKQLVALFRTLGVFGEIAPAEVLRHLDSFCPYLKADNSVSHEHESQIVSEISDLIFQLAPLMTSRDVLRLADGSVVDDLVSITYRFGSGPISSAMRSLAGLASHAQASGDGAVNRKLMKLVSTFYSYLLKNKQTEHDFSKSNVKTRSNISRALSVLGAFCRNHEVEDEDLQLDGMGDIGVQELSAANAISACFSLFLFYLQQVDIETKCAALRALSGIFMSRPRVMLALEQDGTIEDIMSPSSPTNLQVESLRCWKDVLLAEEKRVESRDAKARMHVKAGAALSKQISGDLDGDATIAGGVLTQHAPRLFQMTTSLDHRVRLATVELIGQLLRRGLLNPMQAVPYLFAVQGDVQVPSNRALALRLLIVEGEKRQDMLRQRACAGVKQAFLFQRNVYPSLPKPTAIVKRKRGKTIEVESIFASVFKECIRNSKKQRLGLYRSLLGLFSSDTVDDEHFGRPKKTRATAVEQDLALLSFAAQVLAHLPYNTASDPLFIIHHLSGIAALEGPPLLDRLSSFLRKYGLTGADELDNNSGEDVLEKAARSKSPSRKKDIAAINKADFDLKQFSELCGKACALVLLLRLKSHLRTVWNLSELRCLEYSPDAKERIFDKHVAVSDVTFDANLSMTSSSSSDGGKGQHDMKDSLIRQYAEFRSLMRIEHSVDAKTSSDCSDAEPTPRKRKGSRGGETD